MQSPSKTNMSSPSFLLLLLPTISLSLSRLSVTAALYFLSHQNPWTPRELNRGRNNQLPHPSSLLDLFIIIFQWWILYSFSHAKQQSWQHELLEESKATHIYRHGRRKLQSFISSPPTPCPHTTTPTHFSTPSVKKKNPRFAVLVNAKKSYIRSSCLFVVLAKLTAVSCLICISLTIHSAPYSYTGFSFLQIKCAHAYIYIYNKWTDLKFFKKILNFLKKNKGYKFLLLKKFEITSYFKLLKKL